jgi:hypothetical protein
MSATLIEATPAVRFRDELLRAGLLLATGVDGVYGRAGRFDAVVEAVERLIGRRAEGDEAELMRFPPGMARPAFEASGYFRTMPQFVGTVHCFCGDDADHRRALDCQAAGGDWAAEQRSSDVVLTPASCYPVYPIVARRGPLPEGG